MSPKLVLPEYEAHVYWRDGHVYRVTLAAAGEEFDLPRMHKREGGIQIRERATPVYRLVEHFEYFGDAS